MVKKADFEIGFVLNRKELAKNLNGKEACGLVTGYAQRVQSSASGMFGASNYGLSPGRPGKKSAHAVVYTGDRYAVRSNRQHNTLLKALHQAKSR